MATDIVMPRLSDSMEEGTILKWMKSVGDEVAVGEELVEIETDKANMVYESDTAGTLIETIAGEGDTLPIGEVIARVGEAGEAPSGNGASAPAKEEQAEPEAAGPAEEAAEPAEETAEPPKEAAAEAAPPAAADGRVKASPIARRIAKEKGIDIGSLSGSGPGGRIVKADVEKAAAGAGGAVPAAAVAQPTAGARERPETAKGEVEVVELSKLQSTVARRMAESKATAPHFYLQAEVDMTKAVEARTRLKEIAAEGERVPTFNDMVVKACALALREFPRANGAYRDGRIELYSRVNVGVAVAARDALVVPTVFDADRKGLRQISEETRSLAGRVREGTITPPELSGGTFTVSNLGMYGVTNFHAVINPPQAGILAIGALERVPAFGDSGEVVAVDKMGVTLACDHRILYGADGAEFLRRVSELLSEPLSLAL
ncbi:MAG TPA: dihydrolipoamide acetyltransferase family protein [Solirubrobacterales bacterium]